MTDEIKVGRLCRDVHATDVRISRAESGPVRLSFPASSEMPVDRHFGTEVLRHDAKSIRMDRLNGGAAPLLFNHNWDDPIGMVDSARVQDKRLWVDAHLFDTARAKEVAAMVEGGMRNVSIGYELYSMEEDPKRDRTYTATDWGVLEVSFATIPADPSVGVGRASDQDAKPVRITRMEEVSQPAAPAAIERKTMTVEVQAAGAAPEQVVQQPATAERSVEMERSRRRGIENICRANKIDDNLRDFWIGTGLTIEQLSDDVVKVMEERGKTAPQSIAKIGMSEKEAQQFSMFRAIRAIVDKDWTKAGFELEASRAVAQRLGRVSDPHKFYVPFEVQQRDVTVGTAANGGYLVGTNNTSFIELLRNRSVGYRMGARRLAGLVGNVTVPRQTAAVSGTWLANEASTITEGQQTFGQLSLSPKTVGAYTEISRQLLLQSSPDAEGIVTADLAAVAALAVDTGILSGSGSAGQPTGIINTSGIDTGTAATIAYSHILGMQTAVANANVMPASGGYVTTPTVAALLMQRQRFTSTDSPLWIGNIWDGQVSGFPGMSSLQMGSATMLFGDWSQVVVGEWGVLEIETNPYANFQAGIVGVRAMVTIDVGLRYAGAFSYRSSIT